MSKYFSLFVRIWKLFKPFHKVFYIQLILISTLAAMQVYENVLLGKIVDTASQKDFKNLIIIFTIFVIFQIIYWTFDLIKDYRYVMDFSRKSIQHLRKYSLNEILKLNISQFQENNSTIRFDIITRGEAGMVYIMENILLSMLPSSVLLIFAFITLSKFGLVLFSIAFIGAFVTFYIENKFQYKIKPEMRQMSDRQQTQYKLSSEIFSHLSLIKQLSVENKFIKSYMKDRESNMNLDLKTDGKKRKFQGKRNYIMAISNLFAVGYAIKLYINGNLPLGSIFVIFAISNQVLGAAKGLQIYWGRFSYNSIDAI